MRDPFVLEEYMPHKVWRPDCSCDVPMGTEPIRCGPEPCPYCGAPPVFAGWARGAIEEMAQYQRVHGLKAHGPHRKLAGELFRGLRERCAGCAGSGLDGAEHWAYCLVCEGTGGVWNADEEYLVAAYRLLLHRYPNAAAAGALSAGGVGLGVRPEQQSG